MHDPDANFAVNQFAAAVVEDNKVTLVAPKPGSGLMTLPVTRETDPALFALLSDSGADGLRYLEFPGELDSNSQQKLIEYGVFVEKTAQPELPLFSCGLADFDETPGDQSEDLIVNPSFRFEPFDLTRFRSLTEQHLSPHLPFATARTPVTGILLRIAIPHDAAPQVSSLVAGDRAPKDFDAQLSSKLAAAGVLVSTGAWQKLEEDWRDRIEEARAGFAERGYAVLRGILPAAYVGAMRRFYRAYVEGGFMPYSDPQVPLRYRQHNEPFASILHRDLVRTISLVVGEQVKPSYCYAASYKPTAELKPHVDREQCEYSISLQVDYIPESADGVSPWPLYVEPLTPDLPLVPNDSNEQWQDFFAQDRPGKAGVNLADGDCIFYKGCELVHYRFPLPEGHRSTSIFLHYVPKDFTGSLD